MTVAERERTTPWTAWDDDLFAEPVVEDRPSDDEPPRPPFDGDDPWDDEDDWQAPRPHPWMQRLFVLVGVVVLLCMIVAPVAANLFAGHVATH